MPEIMDHVAHLSQQIGPRPAGTEEEQQAALYIAEQLEKDAGMPCAVEDFNGVGGNTSARVLCCVVSALFAVLSLLLPVVAPAAIIISIAAAFLFVSDVLGKSIISKYFARGVSQNVVAKYEPTYTAEGASTRRRKVILVAHYDTGKVQAETAGPLVGALAIIQKVELVAMILVPLLLIFKNVFFTHDTGAAATVLSVLLVIAIVAVMLLPLATLLHKFAKYNDGANCNASGVGVLLEVATRIGRLSQEEDEDVMMHGEAAARAAGLIPEGVEFSYDAGMAGVADPFIAEQSQEARLAAAKAAIAALSGKPVSQEPKDISAHLVQVKDSPLIEPDAEAISAQRSETREAFATIPAETLEAAGAGVASAAGAGVVGVAAGGAGEAVAGVAAAGVAGASVVGDVAGAAAGTTVEVAASVADADVGAAGAMDVGAAGAVDVEVQSAADEGTHDANVPDWFRKAQQKAKKKPADTSSIHRSRYADALDAAAQISAARTEEAQNETAQAAVCQISTAQGDAMEMPTAQAGMQVGMQTGAELGSSDVSAAGADDVAGMAGAGAAAGAAGAGAGGMAGAGAAAGADVAAGAGAGVEVSAGVNTEMNAEANAAMSDISIFQGNTNGSTIAMPPIDTTALQGERALWPSSAAASSFIEERQARDRGEVSGRTVNRVEIPVQGVSVAAAMPADGASAKNAALSNLPEIVPAQPSRRVMSLPQIETTSALPLVEMQKQRAPLADVASGKDAAKSLLSTLPSIDLSDPDGSGVNASDAQDATNSAPAGREELDEATSMSFGETPLSEEVSDFTSSSPSATGSFIPGATGAFAPVGESLLQNLDPADIYVDDADDSSYEGNVTETGAFAGPGYVDMPHSRVGKFFEKFRFGKGKDKDANTPQEWLSVEDSFDARSVGAARGSWESFRDDNGADDDYDGAYDESYDAGEGNYDSSYEGTYDGDTYDGGTYDGGTYNDGSYGDGSYGDGGYDTYDAAYADNTSNDLSNDYDSSAASSHNSNDNYNNAPIFNDDFDIDFGDDFDLEATSLFSQKLGNEIDSSESESTDKSSQPHSHKRSWHGGAFSLNMLRKKKADDAEQNDEQYDDYAGDFDAYDDAYDDAYNDGHYTDNHYTDEYADNYQDDYAAGSAGGDYGNYGDEAYGTYDSSYADGSDVHATYNAGHDNAYGSDYDTYDIDEGSHEGYGSYGDAYGANEREQIHRFRRADINTEVWFVALGAELSDNSGMKAFLAEHAQDLRGAIIIELEGLGAGELSLIEKEGAYKQQSSSSRMKRYVKKAAQALGMNVAAKEMCWKESAAAYAAKHGHQTMHLAGTDGAKPAYFAQADDVLENVELDKMLDNSDFVMELLKNI